jgi:hypothetical protein
MMNVPFTAACLLFSALIQLGCATRTSIERNASDDEATPTRLFAPGDACAEERPTAEAQEWFETEGSGERVLAVEVFFARECTGAGGDYVLARELSGDREYWLGGHGCALFGDEPLSSDTVYGAIRVNQTAALFTVEEGICVGFPGRDGVRSDSSVLAIAIFETRAQAEAFVSGLE